MRGHLSFLLLLSCLVSNAQADSIYHQLQEVEIKPFSQQAQLRLLSAEGLVVKEDLKNQNSTSLLPALNTIPGVRMEERSPGSYRLSIRGSLLRSPFGVRNVKIYLGDFPFTDAGGNTYLSSLDIGLINSVRILKGPEGSLFGANTGGVLLIDPVYKTPDSLKVIVSINAGSYGMLHQQVMIQKKIKKLSFNLTQGFQRADGYRENSAMTRHYAQGSGTWYYTSKSQLKLLVLFSDLYYQTPGGLTASQFTNNPRSARPASATLPGAIDQKAAIYNQTVFGGLSHQLDFNPRTSHIVSVFASGTNFKNPFITNYEERREKSFGARSYFEIRNAPDKKNLVKWNIGGEWQQTQSEILNYGNQQGNKALMQASDDISARQSFLFTRILFDFSQRLLTEFSLSYNFFKYQYRNNFPDTAGSFNAKNFNPQLIPRIALSYKFNNNISLRASASGGYSPPSIAEIRSSDNVVNTRLQAETAESYETGLRFRDNKDVMWLDAGVFYYRLKSAIVRRINEDGNEYFINAGGTLQPGLETQLGLWLMKQNETKFIRALKLTGNLTYNQFSFSAYQVDAMDYSNNKLTGVPDYTSTESVSLNFPLGFSFYSQYYFCSQLPLNDANTDYAKAYHLLQLKISWEKQYRRIKLIVFGGSDNVLNQEYSLGNDLNAVGSRYYNAAAPRNYYGGLRLEL